MFNARRAAALRAGDHLTVDDAQGLRLVATATRRTWTYRFKSPVDGRMRQMKLGEWPSMPLTAALIEWEAARKARATGVDPSAQRKAERAATAAAAVSAGYSVRALCNEFVTAYVGTVAAGTSTEVARLFDRELGGLENEQAVDLTRTQAFDLLHSMRSRPVVARRLRQALGSAWDRALDSGRLPPDTPNWWRLVLRGKLPSKGKQIGGKSTGVSKRVLNDRELAVLIPWLSNFPENTRDALTLYLWTCCRGAEIVAMERREITREADGVWWTVPRGKLKMRRNPLTVDLRVPLVGRALEVVERRLAATSGRWLFPSKKKGAHVAQDAVGSATYHHMPYSQARPLVTRPRLPVTHWAPHDLRRTGRTMLSALGCPAEIGEAILGHMPAGVQGVYDRHAYEPERRLWLTRLSERLESLVG